MTDAEQLEFDELGRHTYWRRLREVLREGAPSCGSKGQHSARCVRMPSHKGFCEGNGFDEWGPKYECWLRPGATMGTPLPLDRRLS